MFNTYTIGHIISGFLEITPEQIGITQRDYDQRTFITPQELCHWTVLSPHYLREIRQRIYGQEEIYLFHYLQRKARALKSSGPSSQEGGGAAAAAAYDGN